MSIAPIFTPFLDDEEKMRVTKLAKKQIAIGSNLKSNIVSGTQILNWVDDKKQNTLHCELMRVESIVEKSVISAKGTEKFVEVNHKFTLLSL